METLMKVDAALVKRLREEKAWSQEHLATVAAVSLRTIQRVESDGSASLETRMALASALPTASGGSRTSTALIHLAFIWEKLDSPEPRARR